MRRRIITCIIECREICPADGNIGSMVTGLMLPNSGSSTLSAKMQAMAYHYDQLNRITAARSFDNYTYASKTWQANAGGHSNYQTAYTYDGNGNILRRSPRD
ncbi:MAG: hypothetical protein R3C61_15555 [Bacteroidia bacterium]